MIWVDLGPAGVGLLDLAGQAPAEGAAIRVQIARDAQGGKRHGLRRSLEIPAPALILIPGVAGVEIPRSLPPARRKALRSQIEALTRTGEGWALRSLAGDLSTEALSLEMDRLRSCAPPPDIKPPRLVWQPDSVLITTLRAWSLRAPDAPLVCDDGELLTQLRTAKLPRTERTLPGSKALLADHADTLGEALSTRLPLPQGGLLHIEATQALTAIDVDLGGAHDIASAVTAAAAMIGAQIRLRDLGGLIVIDLPRLKSESDRTRALDAMASTLAPCQPPVQILGFTRAGLLELRRPRAALPWTSLASGLDAFLAPADRAP